MRLLRRQVLAGRLSHSEAKCMLGGKSPFASQGKLPAIPVPPDDGPPATGRLNPEWGEWLMGYPTGWTACAASATPLSRRSPKSSSAGSAYNCNSTDQTEVVKVRNQ
jgi:hypothetical protein